MNERIQQLADQYITFRLDPDSNCYEALICPEDLELFAELLIKETMQVVANNLPQNTYLDVADAVIEHFKE